MAAASGKLSEALIASNKWASVLTVLPKQAVELYILPIKLSVRLHSIFGHLGSCLNASSGGTIKEATAGSIGGIGPKPIVPGSSIAANRRDTRSSLVEWADLNACENTSVKSGDCGIVNTLVRGPEWQRRFVCTIPVADLGSIPNFVNALFIVFTRSSDTSDPSLWPSVISSLSITHGSLSETDCSSENSESVAATETQSMSSGKNAWSACEKAGMPVSSLPDSKPSGIGWLSFVSGEEQRLKPKPFFSYLPYYCLTPRGEHVALLGVSCCNGCMDLPELP